MSGAPAAPELLSVTSPQWDQALRYLSVVRRLSESSTRTRAEVAAAAAELGCGVIHLYALLGQGAAVGRDLLKRWLSGKPNRISHHLRPTWPGHPWSPGPQDIEPEIQNRLRELIQ